MISVVEIRYVRRSEVIEVLGAPRSMKMGTIASPWRYDAEARGAPKSSKLRRSAIFCYASSASIPLS
jgi:hypothetical protein